MKNYKKVAIERIYFKFRHLFLFVSFYKITPQLMTIIQELTHVIDKTLQLTFFLYEFRSMGYI